MSDLEFHYVVSYREGYGWSVSVDVEQGVFPDGTIYNHTGYEWTFASEGELETLDLDHYQELHSALRLLNSGKIILESEG